MTKDNQPAGHTAGPWTLGNTQRHISTPNRWTVREHEFPNAPYEGQLDDEWGVYPPTGYCGPVALVAGAENARLIASAPDLLEALLELVEFREAECDPGDSTWAKVDAALRRAQPEQSAQQGEG
jgi:hypothetical protein